MSKTNRNDPMFSFQDGHARYRWLLASPLVRIFAAVLDGVYAAVAAAPLLWLLHNRFGIDHFAELSPDTLSPTLSDYTVWAAAAWLLLMLGIQAVLLGRRGQTIGKLLCNIRVVHSDGRPAGFIHALLLRSVLFPLVWFIGFGIVLTVLSLRDNFSIYGLMWIPYVINLAMLFNSGDDYRTLQDKFAATAVVQSRMRQEQLMRR